MVGHPLDRVEVAVDVEVRRDDEEVDPVELLARPTSALAVSSSSVSSGMIGSLSGAPLPTMPGHMALCSFG